MGNSGTWTQLHAHVHTVIKQRQLLRSRQPILIAVSGGQDSLCLLKILHDLQDKWSWHLAVAHCDHRWSTDVGLADHVARVVKDFGLPYYQPVAPPLAETEAAAREWRYQALGEVATREGFEVVVTGHTRSDRAETFLFNLLRGTGIDGLSALTWERSLTPQVRLVRPLLEVSRAETGAFCQQFRLPVWEDIVNENLNYARNRIRRQLLPYLKQHFNPQIETALAHAAELLRGDVEYLETIAQTVVNESQTLTGWEQPEAIPRRIHRPTLQAVPLAIQRRGIRQFLKQYLRQTPDFEQVEATVRLLNAPNHTRTSTLGKLAHSEHKVHAEVQGDWICLVEESGGGTGRNN
jgi:tRNA(Ile)-lysidine synthase